MSEEQFRRADGGVAPSGAPDEMSATTPVGAAAGASSPPMARVEGVPSEQLWRAAILAARQAAVAAAELRRAFEEATPRSSSAEGAGASLMT